MYTAAQGIRGREKGRVYVNCSYIRIRFKFTIRCRDIDGRSDKRKPRTCFRPSLGTFASDQRFMNKNAHYSAITYFCVMYKLVLKINSIFPNVRYLIVKRVRPSLWSIPANPVNVPE